MVRLNMKQSRRSLHDRSHSAVGVGAVPEGQFGKAPGVNRSQPPGEFLWALLTSILVMVLALEARKFFKRFLDSGEIVKVTDEFYFSRTAIDQLVATLRKYADGTMDRLIDVARFKEIAGVSRKYAIPLLEYFDRSRVTQRAGDKRIILK